MTIVLYCDVFVIYKFKNLTVIYSFDTEPLNKLKLSVKDVIYRKIYFHMFCIYNSFQVA